MAFVHTTDGSEVMTLSGAFRTESSATRTKELAPKPLQSSEILSKVAWLNPREASSAKFRPLIVIPSPKAKCWFSLVKYLTLAIPRVNHCGLSISSVKSSHKVLNHDSEVKPQILT